MNMSGLDWKPTSAMAEMFKPAAHYRKPQLQKGHRAIHGWVKPAHPALKAAS